MSASRASASFPAPRSARTRSLSTAGQFAQKTARLQRVARRIEALQRLSPEGVRRGAQNGVRLAAFRSQIPPLEFGDELLDFHQVQRQEPFPVADFLCKVARAPQTVPRLGVLHQGDMPEGQVFERDGLAADVARLPGQLKRTGVVFHGLRKAVFHQTEIAQVRAGRGLHLEIAYFFRQGQGIAVMAPGRKTGTSSLSHGFPPRKPDIP